MKTADYTDLFDEKISKNKDQPLAVRMRPRRLEEFAGLPECRIPLAQAAVYVACAPKSNAAYLGIEKATEDAEKGRLLEVPEHLKDTHYKGAEKLGHGKGYQYAHEFPGHYLEQEYMPSAKKYYEPTDIGYEAKIKERLEKLRKV